MIGRQQAFELRKRIPWHWSDALPDLRSVWFGAPAVAPGSAAFEVVGEMVAFEAMPIPVIGRCGRAVRAYVGSGDATVGER